MQLEQKGGDSVLLCPYCPLPGLCLAPPGSCVACSLTTAGCTHSSLSLMRISAKLLWFLTPSVTCLCRGLLWLLITLTLYAALSLRLIGWNSLFGQGRLLWLIILDSCNVIQASAVARVPSLTKVLSFDTVFLTQCTHSMIHSTSPVVTAASTWQPPHHVLVHQAVWLATGLTCCQIWLE